MLGRTAHPAGWSQALEQAYALLCAAAARLGRWRLQPGFVRAIEVVRAMWFDGPVHRDLVEEVLGGIGEGMLAAAGLEAQGRIWGDLELARAFVAGIRADLLEREWWAYRSRRVRMGAMLVRAMEAEEAAWRRLQRAQGAATLRGCRQ